MVKRASAQKESGSTRLSITFPPETFRALEAIAEQKRVSVAWVVRDAAETYLRAKWPLLHESR